MSKDKFKVEVIDRMQEEISKNATIAGDIDKIHSAWSKTEKTQVYRLLLLSVVVAAVLMVTYYLPKESNLPIAGAVGENYSPFFGFILRFIFFWISSLLVTGLFAGLTLWSTEHDQLGKHYDFYTKGVNDSITALSNLAEDEDEMYWSELEEEDRDE